MRDVEAWALHYISSTDLRVKLAPPPTPDEFCTHMAPLRIAQPGRPPELKPAPRGQRLPKPQAFTQAKHRARALHSFFHNELQAAELMCWALLAFCDAEPEFRRGLVRVCWDEIRHMQLYRAHIEYLGFAIGDFGVRDWFWSRVPACPSKLSFVAVMGMGLEAANLEYAPSFAAHFRAVGDEAGAALQERVAEDELAHVRFATQWFREWTGGCDFATWVAQLPPPWSPWVLRGEPMAHAARRRAGMSDGFVAALAAYVPELRGRSPA
jgi:uncharacterized ferritin-like protein (DUF455 family)